MQIVIDIPKDVYKEIYNGQFDTGGYFKANLRDAFRHGTPLPKGHGDLIDRSELLKKEVWGTFGETGYDAPCIFKTEVNDAPTIIEADKEDKE